VEVSGGIGIGIGIGFVAGVVVMLAFSATTQNVLEGNPILENIPTLDFDKKAELLYLDADYIEETSRLKITVRLTDEDAEYTKDTGVLDIVVKKDGRTVFTDQYKVTDDDFYTWKDNNGNKVTGALVNFYHYFGPYSHDVIVDFVSEDSNFIGATTNFFSLND